MSVNRGFGLTFGFGEESSWGTAVSRTNWLRGQSSTLQAATSWEMVPDLGYYGQASTMQRNKFPSATTAGGDITFPMAYNDSTLLVLKHLFGADADAGGGPYLHTLTLASPTLPGLTIEQISGTGPSDNLTQVYEGCKVASATMEVSAGGIMMCTASVIAETAGSYTTAGTPSYNSAPVYIQHNHAGSLSWNSASFVVQSLRIRVDRQMQAPRELGSLLISQPFEDGLMVEIEASGLWRANTAPAGNIAGTDSDLTITFTGPSNNSLAITAHNCHVASYSNPTNAAGGIQQTMTWRAKADGSDQGLTFVVTNANTTTETN